MNTTASNYDEQQIILNKPGAPFHGLTDEKAQMINSVLCGRRVIVTGGQKRAEEFMFYRLLTPGSIKTDPFIEAYDIELFKWYPDGHYAAGGSTRVLSPSLVTRFEVVPAPELTPCGDCGRWLEASDLHDAGWDEAPSYGLRCRRCDP